MARKKKEEKENSERWLLTYSDLMNLLLILFIILYASSKLDAQKAQAVTQSINAGFSTIEGTAATKAAAAAAAASMQADGTLPSKIDTPTSGSDVYWESDQYVEFFNEINKLLKDNNLQEKVDTTLDDTGVIISFKDNALFAQGSATINDDAISVIDKISNLLKNLNYSFILVEGHTDSDPISTPRFVDNMELSSTRAGNVWRELVKSGLPPGGMASIGYGEYRPIAPNDTAANKSKNRRVVITILKKPFKATADLSTSDLAAGTIPSSGTTSGGTAQSETTAGAIATSTTAP